MSAPRRALAAYVSLSVAGALLVTLPGYAYRIDRVRCDAWPAPVAHAHLWLLYVIGVALMAVAWLRISDGARPDPRIHLKSALMLGLLPHVVALTAPMFLSEDPLAYAAFGHAIARYHGDPHLPLATLLPAADPFLLHVQPAWRASGSTYSFGFNALAALIARIGGDDFTLQLRLYQLVGMLSMLATAWLAALTTPRDAARTAALVLFCPLAVVEGTMSAHNDGLLAVTVALAALAFSRGQRVWTLVALAAGLAIKDSAILLVALYVLHLAIAAARLPSRSVRVQRTAAIAAALLGVVAAWKLLPWLSPATASLLRYGHPTTEYCVRSVECLPRALLFWVLHLPRAAFAVNLVFRAAAAAFLLYVAYQSARDGRFVRWSATFLFLYYLYLHAFSQSWYLLSLLPLLPFASERLFPAMRVFLICLVAYYAVDIPLTCAPPDAIGRWAATHVLEGVIVIAPATFWLLRRRTPGA